MFRILCDPSSGSTELRLTEITRNFEPVVCVYGPADQAHDKISVNHYE